MPAILHHCLAHLASKQAAQSHNSNQSLTIIYPSLTGLSLTVLQIEAVEEALSVHSQSLTTTQFQQEVHIQLLHYNYMV